MISEVTELRFTWLSAEPYVALHDATQKSHAAGRGGTAPLMRSVRRLLRNHGMHRTVTVALLTTVLVGTAKSSVAQPDPDPFCVTWNTWSEDEKVDFVLSRADSYVQTSPYHTNELSTCAGREALRLARVQGRFYMCDTGNDFTDGLVLGQVLNTALILCARPNAP